MKRWLVLLVLLTGCGNPTTAPPSAQDTDAGAGSSVAGDAPGEGRIAYVTDSSGCDDCHVSMIEPDGSGLVELTDQAIGGPRWSPDGTRLIFPALAEDGRVTTASIAADGSGFVLFDLPDPTLNVACWGWSPDGTRLACESWDETQPDRSGVYTVSSTDGQDLERLTANPYGGADFPGDFSPDGDRYAFTRENPQGRNGTFALFVVDTDGSGLTRLTPWKLNADGASWSPDGERIVFGADGTLHTVRPDGSDITPIEMLTEDYPSDPSWSADGARLVFTMQGDIFTVAADGSDLRQLTDTPSEDGFADWGPS